MLTLQQVFDELHDDARPDSILTALEGLLVEAERRLRQIEAGVRCTNTEGCACVMDGARVTEYAARAVAAAAVATEATVAATEAARAVAATARAMAAAAALARALRQRNAAAVAAAAVAAAPAVPPQAAYVFAPDFRAYESLDNPELTSLDDFNTMNADQVADMYELTDASFSVPSQIYKNLVERNADMMKAAQMFHHSALTVSQRSNHARGEARDAAVTARRLHRRRVQDLEDENMKLRRRMKAKDAEIKRIGGDPDAVVPPGKRTRLGGGRQQPNAAAAERAALLDQLRVNQHPVLNGLGLLPQPVLSLLHEPSYAGFVRPQALKASNQQPEMSLLREDGEPYGAPPIYQEARSAE